MLGHTDIAIDLGTSTVLAYIKGRGIVLREPAMAAVDTNTRNIIAVGDEARRMQGRTPLNIKVVRPLRDGSVMDFDVIERMLRYFIHKIVGRRALSRPYAVVCVPSGVTDMEKRSIIEATLDAGARRAQLMDSAVAGALGAGLEVDQAYGSLLVDIGGGVTDISVVAMERAVVRTVAHAAGDTFDDTIMRFLRKKHNLMVGERTAEEVKTTIGSAVRRTEQLFMDVTGRNMVTGLPRTVRVNSDEITEALEEPVQALVEQIQSVLERTPPELAADVFDHGLTLLGGGAQLFALDRALSRQLKLNCRVAEDPQACVCMGAGRTMEEGGGYERAMFDLKLPGRKRK
ncbi:MAG: rod shape-determining protein MreB [Clostridiales bacterium]|nr:rod shape-determining protein MreB [Clostridiales bacterium]MDY2834621.1 rod shape-determining protein MreB [Candidatus Aphodomonas sp.]